MVPEQVGTESCEEIAHSHTLRAHTHSHTLRAHTRSEPHAHAQST